MRCPRTTVRLWQTAGMSTGTRPILVLDSASLYYRSFFALPESMTAPDGRPHNAVRGFLSTMARLIDAHAPGGLVACWDNDWRPAWRVELVPGYKAHRVASPEGTVEAGDTSTEAEPESLTAQARAIADLLGAIGITRLGIDGFEADDVVGSLAAQLGGPVVVVSGDRDLVQVVDSRTSLHLTVNGGMEKWPLLDPDGVRERFGVDPSSYVDMAVLRGDPSDGLPGVPGIGAKTAVALVSAFGGIDGILKAADVRQRERPMTPRLAAALLENREAVIRARTVARVVTDLPVASCPTRLPNRPADADRLDALVAEWGVVRQMADLAKAIRRQTVTE